MTTIIITLVIVNIVVLIHNNLETMKTINLEKVKFIAAGVIMTAYFAFAVCVKFGIIRF